MRKLLRAQIPRWDFLVVVVPHLLVLPVPRQVQHVGVVVRAHGPVRPAGGGRGGPARAARARVGGRICREVLVDDVVFLLPLVVAPSPARRRRGGVAARGA
jgi:hypothetical protein